MDSISEDVQKDTMVILGFIRLLEVSSKNCLMDFEDYIEVCSQIQVLAWEYMLLTGKVHIPVLPPLPKDVAEKHQRFMELLDEEMAA